MLTRRAFVSGACAAAAAMTAGLPSGAAELKYNDDGLIVEPWYMDSFLIMQEDLVEATNAGKRLAILWELKGCPYCKEMHHVNLAKPEILDFVKSNFAIVQLNFIGARNVTDFDGEVLSEKALARKWQVNFTPTIQFFPTDPAAAQGKTGRAAEVARMPGYFKLDHFFAMFRYVKEEAYKTAKFHEYLRKGA